MPSVILGEDPVRMRAVIEARFAFDVKDAYNREGAKITSSQRAFWAELQGAMEDDEGPDLDDWSIDWDE